jgi:putative Holliday junction resolvase
MIIAVDLGKKTTGIAISDSTIATPYKTITHTNLANAVTKISKICEEENVTKVVVGFVEGKINSYFLDFAQKLKEKLPQVEIVMWDETLTSQQALETMINNSFPKNKRRQREHEIAASLILQSYLDNK